jgi:hypothetical protein
MPTAPHPRNRLGLGIVVITIFACFAVELLELVIKGPTKDAVQSLSPVGLVAILASTIGWWLFASYDPEIPDAPRVRLWLRIAACATLVTQAAILLAQALPLIGIAAWPPGAALFYLSLVQVRRIARATGDTRLASHSLWCMIFAPVLFLAGIASMMATALIMTLEVSAALEAVGNGQTTPPAPAPALPHIPSWAMYLPMIPMMSGTLWYVALLTVGWIRFSRRARPVQYAPAY